MVDNNVVVQVLLVLVTISIAVVTWIKMSESNNLLKKELDVRLRPTLSRTVIGNTQMKTPDETVIHEPVFSLQSDKVLFHFTNNGQLPATKIIQTSYIAIKRNDGFHKMYKIEDKELVDMAPNEKYSVDLFYELDHYKIALTSGQCYFGLRLDYADTNSKKYTYKMEGHFNIGYLMLDNVEIN